MLYCYVYQFNTGDEDDEKAGSNEYSINKRTKEQHSAEFCLSFSHKSSMKDKEKKRRKRTMTINVYKDGHSQILYRDKKKEREGRFMCMCL
jgi:hypothetical protein